MFWAKNNPKAAARRGIKPSVADEFTKADPGGELPAKVDGGKPENRRYRKMK